MFAYFTILLVIICFTNAESYPKCNPIIANIKEDHEDYRLPLTVIPDNYNIFIEPNFDNFTFQGAVEIRGSLIKDTQVITLHSHEITINGVHVSNASDYLPLENYNFTTEKQFLNLYFEDIVAKNTEINIIIGYSGILNEENYGFYKALYKDTNGVEKWFALTKFEPTGARQAFPCFDEPALKATFEISIQTDKSREAISNAHLAKKTIIDENTVRYDFEKSWKMQTYLVAFMVSDFTYESESTDSHFRIYARPQYIDEGRAKYSCNISRPTVDAMVDFVNVPYVPQEKLYHLAIPNKYFASGAMENWAIITYKEQYLLYLDGLTTSSEKQKIALIIAHEIAHQWFGNLVSPHWWTYLWLNEGFATYFEHNTADVVAKEMDLMDQFTILNLQPTMKSDEKAGSVIRMMEHSIGTETFKKGLNKYLLDRGNTSATEDDLWKNVQLAVNEDGVQLPKQLEVIMKSWSLQSGVPLVSVRGNPDGSVTLTQERYFEYGNETEKTLWHIPISYSTEANKNFDETLPQFWLIDEQITPNELNITDQWIILNNQQTGYYRVNYDEELWHRIIHQLHVDHTDINLLNRAQIIDDIFALMRSGHLKGDTALHVLQYIKNEREYVPYYSFFEGLNLMDTMIRNDESYSNFTKFMVEHLTPIYEYLGSNENSSDRHVDKLNRINVLKWICYFGYEDCLDQMKLKFDTENKITPDSQAPVYCGVMRRGNETDREKLMSLYISDDVEDLQKLRIISGLGCDSNESSLTRLLKGENIRPDDQLAAIQAVVMESSLGVELSLNYLITNHEELKTRLSKDQISSVIRAISSRLIRDEHVDKMKEFLDSTTEYPSGKTSALTSMENNKRWMLNNAEAIKEFLIQYYTEELSNDPGSASATKICTSLLLACCLFAKTLLS